MLMRMCLYPFLNLCVAERWKRFELKKTTRFCAANVRCQRGAGDGLLLSHMDAASGTSGRACL